MSRGSCAITGSNPVLPNPPLLEGNKFYELSRERIAREIRKSLPDSHFRAGFGMKNEVIIPELMKWATEPEEIRRLSLRNVFSE